MAEQTQMHLFLSEVSHVDEKRVIVTCKATSEGKILGSAIGQDSNAELAEERALSRLKRRIDELDVQNQLISNGSREMKQGYKSNLDSTNTSDLKIISDSDDITNSKQQESTQAEPTDWNNEIEEIKLEIKRIGWDRDKENTYLEKTFGYNNRNKITTYLEIKAYLYLLRDIEKNADPVKIIVNQDRQTLFDECNILISQLNIDTNTGRKYLKKYFKVSSRQELNELQLRKFNILLRTLIYEKN